MLARRLTEIRLAFTLLAAMGVLPAYGATSAETPPTPFTVEDLVRLKRLSDPQLSPDGRHIAFVLRETDLDANQGRADLWLLDRQSHCCIHAGVSRLRTDYMHP